MVENLIKAYQYFKNKNLEIDLVILNEEKNNYDSYVKNAIHDVILDKNLEYMLNTKGGIYVLNNVKKDDKKLIENYSKLIIDASKGNILMQLADYEENIPIITINENNEVPEFFEEEKNVNQLINSNLKYYNEYGGFSQDGKEYLIRVNKNENIPAPWSHIMANEKFGTIVTESMGGYTWYKNSRLNRVSSWSNNPVIDIPSEVIYLKDDQTKKNWSLGSNPMPDNNDYYITYGFGYAKYFHTCCGLKQEVEIFVPKEDSTKVQIIKLKNETPRRRKIKLVYYLKPVLGEDETKTNEFLNFEFNKNTNTIIATNPTNSDFRNVVFISSSEKIKSYTGIKSEFFGSGNLNNPDGLKLENFSNKFTNKISSIIAVEFEVQLEALENKEISITLGTSENNINAHDLAYKYSNLNNCNNECEKIKKYWNELLGKIQVQTPIESMNILLNGWIMYQTLQSRIIGRTGFYQSGGAYGFRDQLQDSMSVKYLNPEITKKQIIKHSMHQFIEGDVEHWWHEETNRGIRTRFSDDLLWLPYVTADYIEYTGDYSILDVETNYLKGEELKEGIYEKYDLYLASDLKGTIYEHCIKAIDKSLNFGEHGLPKIGSGDWNDGFSTVGNMGKGESVWLAFFLCSVLEKFSKICEYKKDEKYIEYKKIIENLKKTINNSAWDGRWFKRAFMDDGRALR